MNLLTIGLFVVAALPYAYLPRTWREWYVLVGSLLAVYALQPVLPIRFSDFILPTVAVSVAVALWWWTRPAGQTLNRADRSTLIVTALVLLALAGFRYVDAEWRLTPSRPPEPLWIGLGLLAGAGVVGASSRLFSTKGLLRFTIGLIVVLFIVLKAAPLAAVVSGAWRGLSGQDVTLASSLDFNWLGFSYLAFRCLHLLRDRQNGLLPELTLRQTLTFLLFAPAYTAGPIARVEQFKNAEQDVEAGLVQPVAEGRGKPALLQNGSFVLWAEALYRIASGLFKKFVIADTLAAGMSLTPSLAAQTHQPLLMWALLYGYALRLFFDFSGYSDIAIGLGLLFGYRLPENFNAPYLKSDLTHFWKSWHISLSDWARFYVFTPLSRQLLRWKLRGGLLRYLGQATYAVLIAHLATMLTIGLWHGVTVNFVVWGVWHALGLYAHKRWTDSTRAWQRDLAGRPTAYRVYTLLAWFITLQFVVLGWVWFALPDPTAALHVLRVLIGGAA